MTPRTLSTGLLLGLLLPASVFAQDVFPGQYDLKGKYSTRRSTKVELKVTKRPSGGIVVTRTGSFTSNRFRHLPAFTWTSSQVRITGRRMEVTFVIDAPSVDADGLIGGLNERSSDREIINALNKENRFRAVYFLSRNKKNVRELVLNQTRLGDHSWWRHVSAKGTRVEAAAPPPALTPAAFTKKARKAITDWYLEDTKEYYDDALANAADADERKALREAMDLDMDPDAIEFMSDTYWEDDIKYRYDDGEPYLDAFGQAIPLENVTVISLSMFPEYAGIGLSKAFVFDNRTGEIIDEGDIQD